MQTSPQRLLNCIPTHTALRRGLLPMNNDAERSEQNISVAQVRQVAALCRIALTDAEAEQLRGEMAGLLEEVSVLQEIDTTGVEPTGHAVEEVLSVMRDDEPRPPMDREETLANAPRREGDFFRVQAVMDES